MTSGNKKQLEKKQQELRQLKQAFNLLSIDNFELIDSNESPDFIVGIGGKTIGVEVTELYRKLGQAESIKTQVDLPWIADEAMKVFAQHWKSPFDFSITFNGSSSVEGRRKISKELGKFLCECAANHAANGTHSISSFKPECRKYPTLTIVNIVDCRPSLGATSARVILSSFNTEVLDNRLLHQAIEKKLVLLEKYRDQCEIIWLLVTIPFMKLSSDLRLPDKEGTTTTATFDAVYVIDEYRNQILQVRQVSSDSRLAPVAVPSGNV